MATWPDTAELAQVLNVTNVEDWTPVFDSVLAASIDYVKLKRGGWVEGTDSPDHSLRMAALRMAEMMSQRPTATPDSFGRDPTFQFYMYGHRVRFGIA